jgi:hypothetical protein
VSVIGPREATLEFAEDSYCFSSWMRRRAAVEEEPEAEAAEDIVVVW